MSGRRLSLSNMKIVFFGTPDYVIPILEKINKTFKGKSSDSGVVAVITQKPKPTGRKQILSYSPVDDWAHKKRIEKFYSLNKFIESEIKSDVGILAAYGEILPKSVLNYFPHGILNIHPSLLPKFRGASPIQSTIVTNEKAGVTIIKLDEKMDHGPIISQFGDEIYDSDTTETLRSRLFEASSDVLITLLPAYIKGKITPRSQDHTKATFTTLVKKADGFIPPKYVEAVTHGKAIKDHWNIPFIKSYRLQPTSYNLERFIRAMQPWPVAWTKIRLKNDQTKRLKIFSAHVEEKSNKLILDEVQLEGKNPVSWKQFVQAYPEFKFN